MSEGRIMVIDDSPTILKVTARQLEQAGYEVITAGNERSMVEITLQKPDLVLLDVSMPGLTGDRIAELLTETGMFDRGLIVFFSTKSAAELEELVSRTGVAGYIRKDLDPGEFLSQVLYWMNVARRP